MEKIQIISDAIPSSEVLCFRGSLRAWERQGNQVVGTAMLPRFSIEQQFFMLLSMILLSSTFFDWGYIIIFFVCSGLLFAAASGKCMLKRFISKMPWNKGVFD